MGIGILDSPFRRLSPTEVTWYVCSSWNRIATFCHTSGTSDRGELVVTMKSSSLRVRIKYSNTSQGYHNTKPLNIRRRITHCNSTIRFVLRPLKTWISGRRSRVDLSRGDNDCCSSYRHVSVPGPRGPIALGHIFFFDFSLSPSIFIF